MSAAHKLVTHEQVHIGGAIAAPAARPVTRPAPRKRFKLGAALAMGSIWLVVMALCFTLVQKNAAVRNENADIARMKEEIAQLSGRNLELDGKIANAASVAEAERWAKAHGMLPPSGVVQTLQGKQEAVAHRPGPAPGPAPAVAAQEKGSFWQSLLARFGGSTGQAAGAKQY